MVLALTASDVLQDEFQNVAMQQREALIKEARRVFAALKKGDLAAVAEGCVMYDAKAKDRAQLTLKHLQGQKKELERALAEFESAKDFGKDIQFESPSPETGMTGQATIFFGKKHPKPKNADKEAFPEQFGIELWWSGRYMPNANGPVHATPQPAEGVWHFYMIVAPYSRRPAYLL